jgi:large subunit ribosomal protein L10
MATSKEKKQSQLNALEDKFKNAEGIAFVNFSGPTVNEVQTIRRDLRANGMSYTVIKKTLIALAAKNTKVADFSSDDLEGVVAVITSDTDAIAPAAAIKKLKKDFYDKATKTTKFDFSGSVFEGKFLDMAATTILAETPTKEESYAKIIATLRHGPKGIHSMLTHGLRGITLSLKEADKYATS